MNVQVTDNAIIGEISAQVFQLFQASPVNSVITLQNMGVNPVVYSFQQYVNGAWSDIGLVGTPFNSTLDPAGGSNDVVQLVVSVASTQVRLLASASGGSTISFNSTCWSDRSPGSALPILNL